MEGLLHDVLKEKVEKQWREQTALADSYSCLKKASNLTVNKDCTA